MGTIKSISQRLRESMRSAGIYDEWLEPQIDETANCILERETMSAIVRKEGRTITTIGSQGQEKREAHPLLPQINQYNRTITQQLSALGLNRLKAQAEKDTKDMDRLRDILS